MILTEFLLARITEDEVSAQVTSNNPKWSWASVDFNSSDAAQFGHRFDPARVLHECEAKRRIVKDAQRNPNASWDAYAIGRDDLARQVLRSLAAVYTDHPDFDPAWA